MSRPDEAEKLPIARRADEFEACSFDSSRESLAAGRLVKTQRCALAVSTIRALTRPRSVLLSTVVRSKLVVLAIRLGHSLDP